MMGESSMEIVTQSIRTSPTTRKALPDALRAELKLMRRDPAAYSIVRKVKCGLGCGKQAAYSLTHADCENAGTWCRAHGWIFFDSPALPPESMSELTTSTDQ